MAQAMMKKPYHAVFVRYAPSATSGEMLNLGVVLCCEGTEGRARFLGHLGRIVAAFPCTDDTGLRRVFAHLEAEVGRLSIATDLRVAVESLLGSERGSVIVSESFSGLTSSPATTVDALFNAYVAPQPTRQYQPKFGADAATGPKPSARLPLSAYKQQEVRSEQYPEQIVALAS